MENISNKDLGIYGQVQYISNYVDVSVKYIRGK